MDPFLYDILVRPVSQAVNGRYGSHSKERTRDSGALCQTFNGKLIGLVAVNKTRGLRASGKPLSQSHPEKNKRCEHAVTVSGKVYALYDAPSKKPEDSVCLVSRFPLPSLSPLATSVSISTPKKKRTKPLARSSQLQFTTSRLSTSPSRARQMRSTPTISMSWTTVFR